MVEGKFKGGFLEFKKWHSPFKVRDCAELIPQKG